MGTIDKAAIGWSIGIVLVAVGIAALGTGQPAQPGQTADNTRMDDSMVETVMEDMMADEMDRMAATTTDAMDDTMDDTMMDDTMDAMDDAMDTMDGSGITRIVIPEGTGVPGCEADDACFDPFSATISAGDTVVWSNEDSVLHMVNAGDITADPSAIGFDYPNGFDSGLMMSGDEFEWTFDEPGEYPYLCQVHPWMVASIQVN